MADLVVTCPKHFWEEWIAEGDPAGEPYSGEEWGWYTGREGPVGAYRPPISSGERLYVVAHGRLRGYAPVTDVRQGANGKWIICRRGGGVAVTIGMTIKGFQGWRRVWWSRGEEVPFPDWKTP